MGEACFSPASIALLVAIGGVLQTVIVTLFWLAIRAKEDSIRDARNLRNWALEVNDRAIEATERQADVVDQVLRPRGRR